MTRLPPRPRLLPQRPLPEALGAALLVGIIGAPHGVRGEVRLKSYTSDPADIAGYGALNDVSGKRSFVIESLRVVKDDMCVARLRGVSDREAAQALTHVKLYVERAQLPPADEGEYYHADLMGLRAQTQSGEVIGTITGVPNYGAGDLLEIVPAGGGETLLLPFTNAVVPVVDIKGGHVVIVPPVEVAGEE